VALDEGRSLLFSGGDRAALPPKQREAARIQRGSQLMYELSLLHPHISGLLPDSCWTWPCVRSADASSSRGLTGIFRGTSSRWLPAKGVSAPQRSRPASPARRVLGVPDKGDELFGFGR